MSNEHTQFLRDFANANIDSFEEEQLHMLRNAAREIENLIKEVKDLTDRHAHMSNIALGARADVHQTRRDLDKANKERDAARRDFCNASYDNPHLVARERGWDCFKDEVVDANANNQDFRSTDMG